MRILFLTPQPPDPTGGGGAIRNWHLMRAAADAGHGVDLVTGGGEGGDRVAIPFVGQAYDAGPYARRSTPRRVRDLLTTVRPDLALRLAHPRVAATVARALDAANTEGRPYDVIQIEGIEMWANVPPLDYHGTRPALIYDAHNAEARLQGRTALHSLKTRDLARAAYSAAQWAKLRAYERGVVRTATATLALSLEDVHALETLSGQRVDIVPVGVDTAYFTPGAPDAPGLPAPILTTFRLPFDAVFSGTLDYRPNADAARWLVREVWPLVRAVRSDATLAVVGRNPLPALRAHHGRDGITVTGTVPDDRPYMAGASVYVLPIRFGAGMRLKLLNAMSMECAVVATPAATEGVDVQNGRDLLCAPATPMGFASGIAAMLAFGEARARCGVAARRLMIARHDWSHVTPALLRVYDRIERDRART